MRARILLVVSLGLPGAWLLAPSPARAENCGNAPKARKVIQYGISCSDAKRVVAESVSRPKCRNRCRFSKVGYRWRCEQRPSGLNECVTHEGSKRYTVDWRYPGAKR
ncbi:MAG: hypothetical protein U0R52_05430 [Solirubrobacterales bacterium]